MKSIKLLCIVLCMTFAISVLNGCTSEANSKSSESADVLPTVDIVKSDKYAPDGGISLSAAKEEIIRYLEKNGTKGNISSEIKLSEITVKEAWENTGVQIYRVDVDYAWLYGVAVIKNGKVLTILDGMPTESVFLADLDNDGNYEIYTNAYFGSGIVSLEIRGYNIASGTRYSFSKRMKSDLQLFIRDKALWVKEYPYSSAPVLKGEPVSISKLAIKDGGTLEMVSTINNKSDKTNDKKKVQLFLPQLVDYYNSTYEYWNGLNIDEVTLMEKPLLESEDIISIESSNIKVKKNFIVVKGEGIDNGLIYDDKKEKILKFEYKGKRYNINSKSPELFYNYCIHGVCIVVRDNNIFVVKQRDFKRSEEDINVPPFKRRYKKGPVGLPYVLVIDGKKTELGVLQAAEGEFPIPEMLDSWCYMGFPDYFPKMIPEGDVLNRVK